MRPVHGVLVPDPAAPFALPPEPPADAPPAFLRETLRDGIGLRFRP